MKKKIISVMLVLAMTFAVTACSDTITSTEEATSATISTESETMDRTDENAFEMEYIGYSRDITVYRDVDTGVHYLIYKYFPYEQCFVCPRYNPDGTLYAD